MDRHEELLKMCGRLCEEQRLAKRLGLRATEAELDNALFDIGRELGRECLNKTTHHPQGNNP